MRKVEELIVQNIGVKITKVIILNNRIFADFQTTISIFERTKTVDKKESFHEKDMQIFVEYISSKTQFYKMIFKIKKLMITRYQTLINIHQD